MSKIPDAISKRDYLFGVKKANLDAMAQAFENAGSLSDAAEFYHAAQNIGALNQLREKVRDEGDSFLFLKITRLLQEEEFPENQLGICAQKAESLGKTRYAILAHERLGNEDRVSSLKESIAEDGDIKSEVDSEVFIPENAEEIEELEE